MDMGILNAAQDLLIFEVPFQLRYLIAKGARINGLQDRSEADLISDRRAWEELRDVTRNDLEFVTPWNEKSALHIAIENGHEECAEILIGAEKGSWAILKR